jgi:hypothetical protein
MAEHGDSGSGSGAGFLLVFFGGLIAFWLISGAGEGQGIFGNFASSTESEGITANEDRTFSYEAPASGGYTNPDFGSVSNEVAMLREEVKDAKLWGTRSTFAESVRIGGGNVATRDEDEEYLTLSNSSNASIDLTGWTLESSVSGERARIPTGMELARLGSRGDIMLAPGDTAIVLSGDSPVGSSFRENMCTGYFEEYQDFYPSLNRSCPYPRAELEAYSGVALDDDRCYDFVATLPSCENARAEADDAHISRSCEAFVEDRLTYSGCVRSHAADANFDGRTWRIFLDESGDLWRDEREIIRLLDRDGKTVDVYQY